MEFLHILSTVLMNGTGSFSIMLFCVSALLLIIGVAIQVRSTAVNLTFLDLKPLNWVELTHPYIPSSRTIAVITVCGITLMLAALQTIHNSFPFNDPYQGVNLASFFILGTAIGVLSELKWKGTKEYASAVLAGSALAFLTLMILFHDIASTPMDRLFQLILLLPSIVLVGHMHVSLKQKGLLLTLICAYIFWILVFVLR